MTTATSEAPATRNTVEREPLPGKLPKPHKTGGYDRAISTRSGEELYTRGGVPHREDGPAVVWMDGTQLFYRDGKLHGDPAVIRPDGSTEAFEHGKRVLRPGETETGTVPEYDLEADD